MFIVKARSKESYDFLLKEKSAIGFPESFFDDRNLQVLYFRSNFLEDLHLFIGAMSKAEPRINEIKDHMIYFAVSRVHIISWFFVKILKKILPFHDLYKVGSI